MGLFNHACKVVRSGRSFLRRMIDLLHSVPMHPLHPHPICLNREFHSDLAWWRLFTPEWNGVSFLSPPRLLPMKEIASWIMGIWRLARQPLVSSKMESKLSITPHSSEGALAYCPGMRVMGNRVGRLAHPMPL